MSSLGSATRPSGNSGKSRTIGMRGWYARPASRRITRDARHRDRLVPARPARPRPPGAHRRGPRAPTASCPCSCSTTALLQRPLPVRPARALPARLPARAARRAARARRRPRRARRRARSGAGRARARDRRAASCTSPPTSRRSRWRATAACEARDGGAGVEVVRHPGLFVADVGKPRTKDGKPYSVFSPFWRALDAARPRARCTARRARSPCPRASTVGEIPSPTRSGSRPTCPSRSRPARPPAASACTRGSRTGSPTTPTATTGSRAAPRSSRPTCTSGCLSPRELEQRARDAGRARGRPSSCASSCWRDFYAHVLLNNPGNARHAHQRAMDELEWEDDDEAFERLARGPHGLPRRRRRDAPARRPRLDPQPRAADRRARS